MMSAECEQVAVLEGNGVLVQSFRGNESAIDAAKVLDKRCAALQENMCMSPREIVNLVRVLVPVTRKLLVALAYQERQVVDDNRLEPQVTALGTESQAEAVCGTRGRIRSRTHLHPVRQSLPETDLVTVAQNAGFLLDADAVDSRAVLAFQVSDVDGAVFGKDSCMPARQFGHRALLIGLERGFGPTDGKQIVADADFTQFRMGYGCEHNVEVLIYRRPHLGNQGLIRSHMST